MRRCPVELCLLACVAAAGAQTPLRLELVASGLFRPVSVAAPPGDLRRIFVVGQDGFVRVVKDGVLLPTPFLDLTGVTAAGGELGLLSLAFHPAYASNGLCYVFHTSWPPQAWIKRFQVSASNPDVANPASSTVILQTPLVAGNHNGGMLAFGRDGFLYVSLGDGGGPSGTEDPQNHAQRLDTLLGKILRLDVDNPSPPLAYGIPAGNPFAGPTPGLDEIWSYGLRNPWRLSFDRLTGDLYIGDVGGVREEVDFEPANSPGGRNYGWQCMAGTHCNFGSTVCVCNSPALTMPLHEHPGWNPAGCIIGGYVYRGVAIPDWRGAYFFADYQQDKVWALRHNGTSVTQFVDLTAQLTPPPPFALTQVSGFGEDGYGEIHVCNLAGQVWRIAPITPVSPGIRPYGAGTPGCSGAHTLSANSSAVVGHPSFVLRTTQAPAPGIGLMAIASDADVPGSDPLGLGFVAHVQISSAFLLLSAMTSDSSGVGTFQFAIPPSATLVGVALNAQSLWLWSPAVCTPSPFGWSSSPGLQLVVQP
ncbi:MAG: PQQ-dependent sugar dehydrogenase [Planctomycetota bacterium]